MMKKKRPVFRKIKRFLQTLLLTRNMRTAYLMATSRQRIVSVQIPGHAGDMRIRGGTSDAQSFFEVLRNGFDLQEYRIPIDIEPRTILDIGANIGIITLAFARAYPQAKLFAFEPMPENLELLQYNVRSMPDIKTIPYGLGKEEADLDYTLCDDPTTLGGGTFYPIEEQRNRRHATLHVKDASTALAEYGITDVDIIKIDTEGAEYDILTSLPTDILSKVSIVVGELHGVRDQELLDYLGQWFLVQHTPARAHLSFFKAINKLAVNRADSCTKDLKTVTV